ncbi:MAG: hypothetical protein IKF36_01405 [Bacilli bacterium]|nr:hypothetical protein [Bacilli bacterium]
MYVGKYEKVDYEKLLREYEKNQEVESIRYYMKYILIGIGIVVLVILIAFIICACITGGRYE